jgi:hypothetical protein
MASTNPAMMNPKEEKLAWTLKKRKLRQRYVFLTEKDLKFDEGQKEAMMAMLQKRLGKTKIQMQEIMESL